MKDPEVTSIDPTVLIDRASQPAGGQPTGPQRGDSRTAKGPEVVSVDPTVLIDRASQPEAPEQVEPTMLVQREHLPRRSPQAPHRVTAPTSNERSPLAVDPTVLITPGTRPAPGRPKSSAGVGSADASVWLRLKKLGSRQRSSTGRHASSGGTRRGNLWTPGIRGMLLVVAAVAVTALLVLAVIYIAPMFRSTGQLLTVTKPTHGTIVGGGLECGTAGSDCSTTRPDGAMVELTPLADDGYAFSSFTGPCAPSGRIIMSEARTCGAIFEPVSVTSSAVVWPLTITKPSGGTIMFAPDIVCGALEARCSADVSGGTPVKLRVQEEPGYAFLHFTGDCAPEGETTMTQARTCGATFGPAAAAPPSAPPIARVGTRKSDAPLVTVNPPPESKPGAGTNPPSSSTGDFPASTNQDRLSAGPAQLPQNGPNVVPGPNPIPIDPNKTPPPPPITPEDHAKNEIQQLVKRYCSEYQTLQPARIQMVYPNVPQDVLKDRFREYKSLQCTVTAPPEFDRLDASEAGFAQVKFGMKQVIQMKSGGAPQTVETIVTMVLSRMNLHSPWLIDRLNHDLKPKP
jgi:hypothetical protein